MATLCRAGHDLGVVGTVGSEHRCRACRNASKAAHRKRARPAPDPLATPSRAELRAYARSVRNDPCAYCGAPAVGVDHITPTADGGADDWTNHAACCHRCNARKSVTPLLLFLGWDRAKREFEPWRAAVAGVYRVAA